VSALLLSLAIAPGTTSSLGGQDPSARPALQDLPSAEAVIDRFVEAIGGRAAILAHSSRVAKLTFAGPYASTHWTIYAEAPNRSFSRVEFTWGGREFRTESAFDGEVGWVAYETDRGPHLTVGARLREARLLSPYAPELHAAEEFESMRNLGVVDFEGRPCYKIELVMKSPGPTASGALMRAWVERERIEYFDVETGLMAGWEIPSDWGAVMPDGNRLTGARGGTMRETQHDYRDFGGVLRPARVEWSYTSFPGAKQTVTLESVEHDVDVRPYVAVPPALRDDPWPWMTRLASVMELQPGMTAADVGAGNGWWAAGMARHVGSTGQVFANEIAERLLEEIRETTQDFKVDNVTVVLGSETDAKLPPECCDRMLVRYTYHEFRHKEPMITAMFAAMKPGGIVVIIDDSAEQGHNIAPELVIEQLTAAGFEFVRQVDRWNDRPGRYLQLFRKPHGRPLQEALS
jgi:ubiquinone/menaquinone biosynthesis C-methylase UbiE